MKKTISILALFISVTCFSQTKDSASKSPIDTTLKTLVIVLTNKEYENLIGLLKSSDEKPSVIRDYIGFINSRTQVMPAQNNQAPANKAQPKKP